MAPSSEILSSNANSNSIAAKLSTTIDVPSPSTNENFESCRVVPEILEFQTRVHSTKAVSSGFGIAEATGTPSVNHYTVSEGPLNVPFILSFTSAGAPSQRVHTIMVDRPGNIKIVKGRPGLKVFQAFFSAAPVRRNEPVVRPASLRHILRRDELGGGVYTTTTASATGHGLHKRWHYPEPSLERDRADTSLKSCPDFSVNGIKREPISPTLSASSLPSSHSHAFGTADSATSSKRQCDSLDQDGEGRSRQKRRYSGWDMDSVKAESPTSHDERDLRQRSTPAPADSSERTGMTDIVNIPKDKEGLAALYGNSPQDFSGALDTDISRENCIGLVSRVSPPPLANMSSDPSALSCAETAPQPPGNRQIEATSANIPASLSCNTGDSTTFGREAEDKRPLKRPRDHEYDADEELSAEEGRPVKKMRRRSRPSSPFALVLAAAPALVGRTKDTLSVKDRSDSPSQIRCETSETCPSAATLH